MDVQQSISLFITYVEKEGPFLKIWGQAEKSQSVYIEQLLLGAGVQFEQGLGAVAVDALQAGSLVCAKYKDSKYYRARISSVDFQNECVQVVFIDYGNEDSVPAANVRSLQHFPSTFISVPPLANSFIFAEAHCVGGGDWNEAIFDGISKELRYREVSCTLLAQATNYFLVKLFIGGNDIGTIFVNRGFMQPISLEAQQAVLLSMSMQKRQATAVAPPPLAPSNEINTYKACTLEPGARYPVYVSYVNDGPTHFSVQLKKSEDVLVKLMKEINSIALRLLEEVPLPGTICLARCQEDGNVCRAVVTNEVDNQFKVFYVDFGNYEVVPLEALFQIPFKYVLPKVMAIRFGLAGVEKSTVTLDMQCAFKRFVDNRLLHMTVLPSPARTPIPKCELFDPETKTSALDVLNRAAKNAYPEPLSLNRGTSQTVKVSYVFSCNRFYVQPLSKEEELAKLMAELQVACRQNDVMDPSSIKTGLPCCALFEDDQQWYRGQVVDVVDAQHARVRYIDYGNEETVSVRHLRTVEGELLTVLRPQAIECCLNGYQNMGEDAERDAFLEELILERQFTMKIVEMLDKKAMVELIDASNYNVASLLLDKIAMAKQQVSPLLVQAGNKIEHRKNVQNGPSRNNDNGRNEQRRPIRENKGWNEKTTETSNEKSWRNENKDNRSVDSNSNENSPEGNSWRQNNRGFENKTNERYNKNERFNRDARRNRNEWDGKESQNTVPQSPGSGNWGENGARADLSRPSNENNRRDDVTRNKKRLENASHAGGGDWNAPQQVDGEQRKHNDRKKRNDAEKGNWNGGGAFKRKDNRRDVSEISSSGSERSFTKGLRTSSRNDRAGRQERSKTTEESWNVSALSAAIDVAANDAVFATLEVVGIEAKVSISWFHTPAHFYCQLDGCRPQFQIMMDEMQQFYKDRKHEAAVVGAPVVGLFPEDNVLYRARVLDVVGDQYRIFYIDFGNVSTVSKVFPMEKKFMQLPAQAVCCSLCNVAPPGGGDGDWPDPATYTAYFGKEHFIARFVVKAGQRTYAELFDGEKNVCQLLFDDGLASPFARTSQPINVPLLLGQQFRVVLLSVNNLADVIVVLECGLALSCKTHNLDDAVECHEDVLRGYLEKPVVVYVDNVLPDERLEVTFYDADGNKIVVVEPDDGAYDTVDALCPLLVLNTTMRGFLSHVDATKVFLQPEEYASILEDLLQRLFEFYDAQTADGALIPEEGGLYAAKSSDENWYRARVTRFDDNSATVTYVDYGTTENVAFSALRQLHSDFFVPNVLCLEIEVNNRAVDTLKHKNVVANVFSGETGWEGTLEEDPSIETVEVVKEAPVTPPTTEERCSNEGTAVYVSHIDSPNEFYLQLRESAADLDALQAKLQEIADGLTVVEGASVGVLCAAPFSLDHMWYRAEVLDADDDITTVRFSDFGNTDVIDNRTTRIKTLPSDLIALAAFATRCSLKTRPIDGEWSQQAVTEFERLTSHNDVTARFLHQDEKSNYVELFVEGENVAEKLEAGGFATRFEGDATQGKTTGFVSHLNSPSEFWIQLENCVDELEWIAEQLNGAEAFPELEEMTPGTLCAALFPDDEMWYRARILSNTVAGLELLFIDYGNSCCSGSLRQLPEHVVVTPPLAQKCSLRRPAGIAYWSPQAIEKFKEIAADGQTIFTVKKISTGETAVVELSINGEDVIKRLLPVTEEGRVKNFKSLLEFNVEKNGNVSEKTFKLEAPPGLAWNDESTRKFQEINQAETVTFQIECVDDETVRLYLDGEDVRSKLGGTNVNLSNTEPPEEKTYIEDTEIVTQDTVVDYTKKKEEDSQFCDVVSEETNSTNKDEEEAEEDVTPDSLLQNKDEAKTETETGNKKEEEEEEEVKKTKSNKGEELIVENNEKNEDVTSDSSSVQDKRLKGDEEEVKSEVSSRPHSRLSHDERILPAVLSRPQSPLPVEEDAQ